MRLFAMAMLVAVTLVVSATPTRADPAPSGNVKYYQVRGAFQGKPERLADIAERLLGSASRSGEVIALNEGRTQPDGGRLTNGGALRPGWLLVLPWDAVGSGVVLGPLPTPVDSPPPPSSPLVSTPEGSRTTAPTSVDDRQASRSTCEALPADAAANIPWPRLRLAPDQAWTTTRGAGTTVAVIDTRVDANAPALAGRVSAGVSIGTGVHASCPGHGTAMAGIIAAQPVQGSGLVGIAPDATILPITVDLVAGAASPKQVAAALAAAVAAKVPVVMVGVPVNLTAPEVGAALADAVANDVVVVVGAWGGPPRPGVLRVGAVAADDQLARDYPSGTVDVLAPGDGIVALGLAGAGAIAGSGTDFAVPFVAGLAALVRSSSPATPAEEVASHIEATAEHGSAGSADDRYGSGIIDPAAAIVALSGAAPGGERDDGFDLRILFGGGLAAVLLVVLVWLWVPGARRMVGRRVALDAESSG